MQRKENTDWTTGTWTSLYEVYTKPASNIQLTTGATTRNISNNIYDLAGNVHEWTEETVSTNNNKRAVRGGCSNDSNISSIYREYRDKTLVYASITFRPILII